MSNARTLHSLALALLLVGGVSRIGSARVDSDDVDLTLLFNQKFHGYINALADEDLVKITCVEGAKLSATVKREGSNFLKPDIDLFDTNFIQIDTSAAKTKTGESASIKNFVIPDHGTYYLRMRSINGFTGTYVVDIKQKPVKKPSLPPGTISNVGEVDTITFSAPAGSKLAGTIKRQGGDLEPLLIEIVSPLGSLVPLGGKQNVKLNAAKDTLTIQNIGLPALGDYQLRITGQGGTTGGYTGTLKLTVPKPESGDLYEGDHPNPGSPGSASLTLKEIYFGRGLATASGNTLDVKNPFSLVKTDPVSNLPIPGTLQPLFPGIDLNQLYPFNLSSFYAPPILPRNAVLVMRFNKPVSTKSLNLVSGNLMTGDSPLQVVVNGAPTIFQVFASGNDLILNPAFEDQVGFAASPLLVDASGNPIASTTGAALISIASGVNGLRAADNTLYKPRGDLLGSPDSGGDAIGFNPGNQVLDFFKQSTVGGGGKSYTGFLPDESPPRIVREQKEVGTYTPNFADPLAGDQQSPLQFTIVLNKALNTSQNGGKGEYAGGVVRLRPSGPNREQHVIQSHSVVPISGGLFRNVFTLASPIDVPLKAPSGSDPGEEYEVVRAEFYEPDPENPLDPDLFDPNDPDLTKNSNLINFLEVRDRDGVQQDATSPIDPKSTITVRFSEPMLFESFRPYESFYVTDDPPTTNFGLNYVGRVVSGDGGKAVTYQPYREIQFGRDAGTVEQLGFSPDASALRFHILSVPSSPILVSLLGDAGFANFVREGHRGITDLGGQPLAFPLTSVSAAEPIVDYSVSFATFADATIPKTGAVVHRFLGQPQTGSTATGDTGVTYRDIPTSLCGPEGNIYGPHIADLNLFTNGFLSGAPVAFFQKVHDEFNPPPTGQFTAFPTGASTPIGGQAVLGGSKLQSVYRAVDASPDYESLAGTTLDLYQVAYAPLNGAVSNTILPDVTIHAGHTAVVPDTKQSGGIPQFATSGLSDDSPEYKFGGHYTTLGNPNTTYVKGSYNGILLSTSEAQLRQLCYGDPAPGTTDDFYTGLPLPLDSKNLFKPAGSPTRAFHPLPVAGFNHPFPYNNGDLDTLTFASGVTWGTFPKNRNQSLVIEYRVRVKDNQNPPSIQNQFTFAVGILSSALPRFRIYTIGVGCLACCEAGDCGNTCAVTQAPPLTGLPGFGGNPLNPDLIVNAVGPDVAAPGLTCICIKAPQNNPACGAGLTSQTPATPDVQQAAYGQAAPPGGNNFGDGIRYYMVFNYVKRESYIRSPLVRVQPVQETSPDWLEPILTPSLSELPVGTGLTIRFRAATEGQLFTPFVDPSQISTLNDADRPFIQFEMTSIGNTSSQLVPVFDEIVIPYRKS